MWPGEKGRSAGPGFTKMGNGGTIGKEPGEGQCDNLDSERREDAGKGTSCGPEEDTGLVSGPGPCPRDLQGLSAQAS